MRLILTGDVNLMNVTDAKIPFRHVAAELLPLQRGLSGGIH